MSFGGLVILIPRLHVLLLRPAAEAAGSLYRNVLVRPLLNKMLHQNVSQSLPSETEPAEAGLVNASPQLQFPGAW